MLPEIKAQWVTALRSGDYQQGSGYLTRVAADGSEQDCCLGVLCKLAIKAGLPVEVYADGGGFKEYGGDSATPPPAVSDWAQPDRDLGVSFNPVVEYKGERVTVAELNDGAYHNPDPDSDDDSGPALTFDQIADLIDAQL